MTDSHFQKSYSEIYQDWGDVADDFNSDEWASGGYLPVNEPQYGIEERERYTPVNEMTDYEYPDEEYAVVVNEDIEETRAVTGEDGRVEEIVKWLKDSRLARIFRNGGGFFIPAGLKVRFPDGQIEDVLVWLGEEGIVGGVRVSGYSVVYTPPESIYGEKLSFFEVIYDTPFTAPKAENLDFDDDIPF